MNAVPIELTYFSYNKDTLVLFAIILFFIFIACIIINIFVVGEINKEFGICEPIFFFVGNKRNCKQQIKKEVDEITKLGILHYNKKNEGFDTLHLNDDNNNNNNEMDDTIYNYFSLKKDVLYIWKTIKISYLAMIQFIYSMHHLIYFHIDKILYKYI
jgi:hypothetical protein